MRRSAIPNRAVARRPGGPSSARRFATGCGLALLLATLSACTDAPVTADLAREMPATWKERPSKETGRPTEIGRDWIAGFRSPELTRLAALAETDGLDLVVASARIAEAEATLASTRSGLAPSVSGSASSSRSVTPGTRSGFSPPFGARVADDFQLGVSASWQLDLRGRLRALARADAESLRAARIDREAVRLNLLAAVADDWFRVAAARDRLRIAAENVATAERTLQVYRRRLEVGTASALDVAQQESLLASLRAAVPALEIELRQTRNSLVALTGRPPEALTIAAPGLDGVRIPVVVPGLPSSLLTRRPDVAEAEASLAAQSARVEAARAAFLPDIGLTGSSGLASAFLRNLLRPDAIASQAAANLAETIFDGGAREADLAGARARHEELIATYRKTVHSALVDVENALVAVEQNRRHEVLQRAVVAAARKTQRLTEERLREGTIDITTVLEAERTLFSAEDTLVNVRLARLQAAVSLITALGGGWSKDAPATEPGASSEPQVITP